MRPFWGDTLTVKKLTRKEIDEIERVALEIFEAAYSGQYSRIKNAIKRANPSTLQQFLDLEQWELEPDLVAQSVRKWYDDTAEGAGLDTIETYGFDTTWGDVKDDLFDMSAKRAGWFAAAMTETSMQETQAAVEKWLVTEGETIGDLQERMASIWTGPRPKAAAITETTNIVAQSEVTVIKSEGGWGYNVHTMNDGLVRPHHAATAKNGPYPISDTEHLPPIMGDVNCRCFITPVMEPPR